MRPMKLYELKPGKTVWLESYGYAFKTLRLVKAVVLVATSSAVYFAFPFCKMDAASYNTDLTWRCRDERPDMDILAEEEWAAIVA